MDESSRKNDTAVGDEQGSKNRRVQKKKRGTKWPDCSGERKIPLDPDP